MNRASITSTTFSFPKPIPYRPGTSSRSSVFNEKRKATMGLVIPNNKTAKKDIKEEFATKQETETIENSTIRNNESINKVISDKLTITTKNRENNSNLTGTLNRRKSENKASMKSYNYIKQFQKKEYSLTPEIKITNKFMSKSRGSIGKYSLIEKKELCPLQVSFTILNSLVVAYQCHILNQYIVLLKKMGQYMPMLH